MAFVRCDDASFPADVVFKFTITQRTPHLNIPLYSEYQFFHYETITEQREKRKTFKQIAEWLNKKEYVSVRVKKFKGNHVHSIEKKKDSKMKSLKKNIKRFGLISV